MQAFCVFHCIKKGNNSVWIWIIIFLPVIGCIVYLFSEVFSGNEIKQAGNSVGCIFVPAAKISKLEKELMFSDTFNNRVTLADAYLAGGNIDKAIDLYENSLTGAFVENEHVLTQLILAYYAKQRYADILPLAKKICKLPQFPRSKAHLCYALALEQTGNMEQAEKELKSMKGKFSNFEPRHNYGLFLLRAKRIAEAKQVFEDIINEAPYLGPREKRMSKEWINKAKDELKNLQK